MTDDDRPVFAQCLAWLGETFDTTLSDVRIEAYWQALRELPLNLVTRAASDAVRSCLFFPKPVELREFAVGSDEDQAELAWQQVCSWISEIGSYGYPDGLRADPVVEGAVEACGGWRALCLTALDQMPFAATQFKRTHGALSRRNHLDRMALPVEGTPETNRALHQTLAYADCESILPPTRPASEPPHPGVESQPTGTPASNRRRVAMQGRDGDA